LTSAGSGTAVLVSLLCVSLVTASVTTAGGKGKGGGKGPKVNALTEWYGDLLGNQARFANHPGGLPGSPGCIGAFTGSCFQAVVVNEDERHPTTRHLPKRWAISDELYNFKANPRSTVHVLQTLDESAYDFQPHPFIRNWGTLMGEDHPITWCQFYDGGRVWYTGLGHDENIYRNEDSMTMIIKGIKWAAGKWGAHGCSKDS
jgi:hypothetical protein